MFDKNTRRLSKLVPLSTGVSAAERSSLPTLVDSGEITLFVRVPAGKAVYMDAGLGPIPATASGRRDTGERSLPPYELARARDAKRAGNPVVRYPMIIPRVAYLGLAITDAQLLLERELERVHVEWFPYALQFLPHTATDANTLTQLMLRRTLCCVRPDDGQPKRGPWIGQDAQHALTITLSDVFVELAAVITAFRAKADPLELRGTSPGVYVLYLAAAHFNDAASGAVALQTDVQKWVQKEAKACGIDEWLFNKGVLKQVKKLINTRQSKKQRVDEITTFKLDALGEDEASLHAAHHWISSRVALLMHAARHWRHLVQKQNRAWATMDAQEKLVLAHQLNSSLKVWGFTTLGERRAAFLTAAYPDDLRSITEAMLISVKTPD